jgi:hypothetical protein
MAISPRKRRVLTFTLLAAWACCSAAFAQLPITDDPPLYGHWNGTFYPDGDGLRQRIVKDDSVLRADSPWSMYFWVRSEEAPKAMTLLAGVGNVTEQYPRYLAADASHIILWMGKDNSLSVAGAVAPGKWQLLAATFDGSTFRIYNSGAAIGSGMLALGSVSGILQMAPPKLPVPEAQHFGGQIAHFTLLRNALSPDEVQKLSQQPPEFASILFEDGSKPWPVQTRGQAGYRSPQEPSTMPHGKGAFSKPAAAPLPPAHAGLEPDGADRWTINGGWKLSSAPEVTADAAAISETGFNTKDWLSATVPGTVLTTMVNRGVYPDPDYGLNNLAIPESLNKQDYWYRNEFKAPKSERGRRFTLTFEGINYRAAVWLNGKNLGQITGAFIRGVFDVTGVLKLGETNVLVARISPPPHPGIPQEQSIKGGPGENGGFMCLDGPTFVATEGWDWIPAIRDRDTGIWQPVVLTASGGVTIGDAQVVTKLPLPATDRADVEITVPLESAWATPVQGTLQASFDQTSVSKAITVAPGRSSVKLSSAEFAQLVVRNPRLWWPNGYGKQELYNLKLTFTEGNTESDSKQARFGIREITYELSLLDTAGHLRRLEYSPTTARALSQRVVDVSHEGMRAIPANDPPPADWPPEWREGWKQWVASLQPGGEKSPAVHALEDTKASPYLVIKVNGVRIACRGGNWGMDDSRKRVSRAHLEPFFRLHHDANINIIRNWVGQSTEQVFYDLADEYGLLIWNDFWTSTEDYNIEPQDPALFLDNVRDTIQRFRNHPSIAMWCGRNEGVPQPIISDGIAGLVDALDGTRYYSPSSNAVNLAGSGPYKYQDPAQYYSTLNHGFSVETGTASLSTLESFRASVPKEDQWPIDDVWAYHDWHYSGNGESAPFMAQIQTEFGAGTSLDDFERKAQMLNYVDHRAIFEGMNAHLWAPNSGRLLWMTQPAWPSNMWQILSSDYDTQASYYGVKKACEPLHVQLDLATFDVAVINTTTTPLAGLTVIADVYSLDNKPLLHHEEKKDSAADAVTAGFKLELAPLMADTVVLVKLQLKNAQGEVLSDNLYWLSADYENYRQLTKLPAAQVIAAATVLHTGETSHMKVQLENRGASAALETKLTLLNANGGRILPAYFSDNYVSLLPGEKREIEIEYPATGATAAPQLAIRGWNTAAQTVAVTTEK